MVSCKTVFPLPREAPDAREADAPAPPDNAGLTDMETDGKGSDMTDAQALTPPDRLSTNPRSPHFDMEVLQRGIGIRFKGVERRDVEEYCISEGWIRVAAGKALDRRGQPLTIKLGGAVEAWFKLPDAE